MTWLVFLPLVSGAVMALAHVAVTLLVARAERRRRARHNLPRRSIFRPVLIQGGKAQAPPGAVPKESKSA